jgi:hypothetical protein
MVALHFCSAFTARHPLGFGRVIAHWWASGFGYDLARNYHHHMPLVALVLAVKRQMNVSDF